MLRFHHLKVLVVVLLIAFFFPAGSAASAEVPRPPSMVTSAEWGSRPQPIPESRRQVPVWITIHHAGELWKAGDDPAEFVRKMQIWGQNRPKTMKPPRNTFWPDLPYHYLIAPDGRIFEGRPVEYEPESNTNYSLSGNIGIEMMGDFNFQRPSIAQLRSVVGLTAWLAYREHIGLDHLRTHEDAAPNQTDCPGADFYRYLTDGQLKKWVAEALDGKTPAIDPGPSLADGPFEPIPDGDVSPPERPTQASILSRKYAEGERLHYGVEGSQTSPEGDRRWHSTAEAVVVKDSSGVYREEFRWASLGRDGAEVPLAKASADVQSFSLDPFAPAASPDISTADANGTPSILDLMAFCADAQMAIRRGLSVLGDHFYSRDGKPRSWAAGSRVITGYDCIDFEGRLQSVDAAAKTATVLVRHVPPVAGCEKVPAEWMRTPEPIPPSDTPWPHNWFQIEKRDDGKLDAEAGREVFDVTLTISLDNGLILKAAMDNPVQIEARTCKDAQLAACGSPRTYKIVRKVSLALQH